MSGSDYFDVIIIGAGLSGINTAHSIATQKHPRLSYAILERRGRLGGTWDLFQYPGIRSDSDIYTFGFSWNPWKGNTPLASGSQICAYLSESAAQFNIDQHIHFHHQVQSANWISQHSSWSIHTTTSKGEVKTFRARFLVSATGYYDHDQPLQAEIPGIETFQGPVVQPQFWPRDLDWMNKDVVIIGSGATAVTLLPNMAQDARHTTMLQRSPTYIAALPTSQTVLQKIIRAVLPYSLSSRLNRSRFMLLGYMLYYYCMRFPLSARRGLQRATSAQLPYNAKTEPDFSPRYDPWAQRLCVCPDGDFFAALRSSKANVVTDVIDQVTEDTINLRSGKSLRPDIIIAATGLKLQFGGGMKFSVDDETIDPSAQFVYKGCMLQNTPNFAFIAGYVNASWTLGAEVTATFLSRLWRGMAAQNIKAVTPRVDPGVKMNTHPMMDLQSTYVKKGAPIMPKTGEGSWAPRWNYLVDCFKLGWGNIFDDMEIIRARQHD